MPEYATLQHWLSHPPSDPDKRQRQDTYLRALRTLPDLSIHLGHYLQSTVTMKLANAPAKGPIYANVLKMEEKGSDVNLATYMLVDAFRRDCGQMLVITNDSDLAEPVRIINKELNIPVGLLNPQTDDTALRRARSTGRPPQKARPSIELKKYARFYREISSEGPSSHMAQSQFPDVVNELATGRLIHRPKSW